MVRIQGLGFKVQGGCEQKLGQAQASDNQGLLSWESL